MLVTDAQLYHMRLRELNGKYWRQKREAGLRESMVFWTGKTLRSRTVENKQ
jgi:hypothetical protein